MKDGSKPVDFETDSDLWIYRGEDGYDPETGAEEFAFAHFEIYWQGLALPGPDRLARRVGWLILHEQPTPANEDCLAFAAAVRQEIRSLVREEEGTW